MKKKKTEKITSVLFYGIGGQGVLTAAEICALAAMEEGYHVKKSEVKGMAQRGGSVESYLRFGLQVYSPLPPEKTVDVLVCLHRQEYPRLKDQLRAGGIDIFPYLERGQKAVGEKKIFLNVYLLGVLSSFLSLKEESWLSALDQKIKKARPENKSFFLRGRKEGQNDF